MFYTLILSAGYSSRMGDLKPLLDIAGVPAVIQTIRTAQAAGSMPVVVTGYRADDIEAVLPPEIITVRNSRYFNGMFSSVRAGLNALPYDCEAFFLIPADCCAVSSDTYLRLLDEYNELISYPEYDGMQGHPVLIPARHITGLLTHNGTNGAKGYLQTQPSQSIHVPDPGILLDMDTPEDYTAMLKYYDVIHKNIK